MGYKFIGGTFGSENGAEFLILAPLKKDLFQRVFKMCIVY